MKNIFNEADKNEIIQRIGQLNPSSQALWGKMNVAQMMAHCALGTRMPTGELKVTNVPFLSRIIGRLIKSKVLDESPMRKGSPTIKEMVTIEANDFEKEKLNFINGVEALYLAGENKGKDTQHPFFGKMTTTEWGRLNYKHADHHLRQFGV